MFWAADLRAAGPPPARSAVRVDEVTTVSAPAVAAAMGGEGDLVAQRMARACRCFGAWLGPEVAAYGWLSAGPEWIGELGLEVRPGHREAYVWNCVTLPASRRKGVFQALLLCIAAHVKREGLVRLWIGSVNGVGEKAIAQAGFVPVLRFRTMSLQFRLGGLRWLQVRAVEDVEAGLMAAALGVLGRGGRPLRLGASLHLAEIRRH